MVILMVHSSVLAISTDDEPLMHDGFSIGETIHFWSLEFIIYCFGGLSLSPKGTNPGVVFVGIARSGSLSLWTMIDDSTEELYTASSGEGSSGLPISQRHGMGALPAPTATSPRSLTPCRTLASL
jgi:hypothetical protein